MRMSTFAGSFHLHNGSANIWCWIFQTSGDNLGSCFFESSPLENGIIHEQSQFGSGYLRMWRNSEEMMSKLKKVTHMEMH